MSKQFAIKEVVNGWLSKFDTADPISYIDYASNTTFSFQAERLDLRGGQGNYKLVSFDHTKDGTLSLEMPLVDLDFLAQLTGQDITTGTANVPKREVLTVNGSNQVTLAATPVSNTLSIWKLDGNRDYGTEQTSGSSAVANQYTIAGGVITFNGTSCPENTKVVAQYDYAAPATTRTITFTANKFVGYMTFNGIGKWTDEVTGTTKDVVFEVLKCKPKNNFSITQKSTEATVLNMEFDLYTVDDTNGDKIYMKVYELE